MRTTIIRLIFIVVMSLSVSSCKKKQHPMKPAAYPVQVAKAESKDALIYIDTYGHVTAINTIEVKSRIEGEMMGVYFREGQEVKNGDLLFTIDPRLYQATLDEAKATLEGNIAKLKYARDKVARYSPLLKEDFYSQVDFENLQTDAAALEAQVKQNQASIDKAQINLDYCWIYSPVNGKTSILNIDEGNLVSADGQSQLVTINQMDPIYVVFPVPQNQLQRIAQYRKENQELHVRVAVGDDIANDYEEGVLDLVNNEINMNTAMVKLRGIFNNAKRNLWPGQFVKTRLILTTRKDSVVIPNQAVQITSSGKIVFVMKPDHSVELRKVEIGQREDNDVIILSGVKANEMVVTVGQLNLSNGTKVFILPDNKQQSSKMKSKRT